jgi:hypothetical protein
MDDLLRTRRHVHGTSAQSCSRRVLSVLVPHTRDLDIENCMLSLIVQIIDKLQPTPPPPADVWDVLRRCATQRALARALSRGWCLKEPPVLVCSYMPAFAMC